MVFILGWLGGLCLAMCIWILLVTALTHREYSKKDNQADLVVAVASFVLAWVFIYAAIQVQ